MSASRNHLREGTEITNLDDLPFDNRYTASLPGDPNLVNESRIVTGAAYSRVAPTPVSAPTVLAWSPDVMHLLRLDKSVVASNDFAEVFAGNRVPVGADPMAQNYGGHQFGNWAGQLGDGRAINLGEVIDRDGQHQFLQLKGAGLTPYSRGGDGRAVLRSSIREFLCSEAMHHLGIPTTRALALIATGDEIIRDVLYDGNSAPEPGAIICRVSPSFTRFGTFQLPAARDDLSLLRQLVHVTWMHDYPELAADSSISEDEKIAVWFNEVVDRTVRLVVDWMRVGFVHGVLNTDNMSIVGLTLDYGPYGWLENFDPTWTPNITDASTRRYAYGSQPQIVQWNLLQLANAIAPLMSDVTLLQEAMDRYAPKLRDRYQDMLATRLGWGAHIDNDEQIVGQLFDALTSIEIDQVIFFRYLSKIPVTPQKYLDDDDLIGFIEPALYRPGAMTSSLRDKLITALRVWYERSAQADIEPKERIRLMNAVNPKYVLRNYLAQQAIEAAEEGDLTKVHELQNVLTYPYDEQPEYEHYAVKRPEWARRKVGSSMLSCSS